MVEAVERLLEAGDSFTELSVEKIAAEAGVSRSTFYTYYEDKGHLLREVTEDVIGGLGAIARELWEAPGDVERSQLKGILHHLMKTYRRHDTLLAAVVDT